MTKTHDKRTETRACDLISRQAALDALGERPMLWINNDEYTLGARNQYDMDRLAIETVPSAHQWIPCSERLPKEIDAGILKKLGTEKRSDYVLATVEVNGERMTVTACTYDGEWDWNMKYAFPDYKIVAWMPLPEPWKGNADD